MAGNVGAAVPYRTASRPSLRRRRSRREMRHRALSTLRSLFGYGNTPGRSRLAIPDDVEVVYAIGDVHGCLDPLRNLETLIAEDAGKEPQKQKAILMLGDLIDRGPRSAEVIDHVMTRLPGGLQRYVLAGNHEAAMLAFLDDPVGETLWLEIGGLETLASYGVIVRSQSLTKRERIRLASSAVSSVPEEHIQFLRNLPVSMTWRDYLFVHAGIRPGTQLDRQAERDLLEIREEFTASSSDHGYLVVHGHTPVREPALLPNRVSVDIAAYATGRIAAARCDRAGVTFIVSR